MSEVEAVAGEIGIRSRSPASGRRIVQSRHRDRDFALRRALLILDALLKACVGRGYVVGVGPTVFSASDGA